MKDKNIKKLVILIVVVVAGIVLTVLLLKEKVIETNNTPKSLTKEYLEKYIKLDEEIVNDISYPFADKISDLQKERFIGLVKLKYEQLGYEINEDESQVNEEDAIISVTITSVDIKEAYEKATTYIDSHKDEFPSTEKEIEYKLDTISKNNETESYTIIFNFYKEDGKWKMTDLVEADVNKIKGLF